MPENPPIIPIELLETIDSTSLEARRRLASGPLRGPRALVAARQTGGVGRFGRRWESPAGGLWMTVIWPLQGPIGPRIEGMGLRLGLACARAIEGVVPAHAVVTLKWPNDVLVNGLKVAGLLTEVVDSAAVVGVGVNANFDASKLSEGLRSRATTLRTVTRGTVDLAALRDALLHGFAAALDVRGLDEESLEAVRARLHGVGEPAALRLGDGSTMRGTLLGIADDGRVRLRIGGAEALAPAGAELVVDQR